MGPDAELILKAVSNCSTETRKEVRDELRKLV
jgi:hypothetical protein